MRELQKWMIASVCAILCSLIYIIYLFVTKEYLIAIFALCIVCTFVIIIYGIHSMEEKRRYQDELDISRVLGKDAKDALSFGNVGILTYNDEYVITWQSDFFYERHIDLIDQKVTAWIPKIRTIIDEEVDMITGQFQGSTFEVVRKNGSNVLYVKDVTQYQDLTQRYQDNGIVIGLMQLDNYMEYQSYESEELMENIHMHLRGPLISWAKDAGMLIRRIRGDRFIVVLNKSIFNTVKKQDFTILQLIKDEAKKIDVSISLSMAFAYGTSDFQKLDTMVGDLIELAQSRGGDQVAYRHVDGPVQYIGGNSESSSSRSKVRVRTMAQSIQEALKEAPQIFIVGHTLTDFDCMGAALGISCWARSLGKKVYVVLKDVKCDSQLDLVLDHYHSVLNQRHTFITPEDAEDMIDANKDLVVMVDHSIPAISSGKDFIENCKNVIVIDHHRRNEQCAHNAVLTYIESGASSACELIVEMIQNVPNHIPVYEAEATIMYLGILVDTNRFKMHTDARTFESAAALRLWGANASEAEKSLCVNYHEFSLKNSLIQQAQPFASEFMIDCIGQPVDKTTLAQVAQSLLTIRGCKAAFVFGPLTDKPGVTGLSARSDGTFNVQKIVEQLHGGGHFSAAAAEREDLSPSELKDVLIEILKEETDHESNLA